MKMFTKQNYFSNWFDCSGMSDDAANENFDAQAFRRWARSKKNSPAFAQAAAQAIAKADEAHRFAMKMNNR